jgi:hypothetical protein
MSHRINSDVRDTLKVTNTVKAMQGCQRNLKIVWRDLVNRFPPLAFLSVKKEGLWEEENDGRETKIFLGFIGRGLNDITLNSS